MFKTSSYQATGKLIKDLKFLKEFVIIDLMIGFEGKWQEFKRQFAVRTFRNQREQRVNLRERYRFGERRSH